MEDYVEEGTMLAILAIPSWMTVSDFLTFVSAASGGFSHLRIVRSVEIGHVLDSATDKSLRRDAVPSRAVCLMKFRSAQNASEFLEEFNGRYFNSMEASHSPDTDSILMHHTAGNLSCRSSQFYQNRDARPYHWSVSTSFRWFG